jgi:hypothetical protein
MGCEGLLDFQWGHEEEKWLQEIYKKDMSAFPSTGGANPDLWKEELIADIFGISKVGMGMPQRVPAVNHALKYFASSAHKKEGWRFLECQDAGLRDVLKYLMPLINPMKPARVTCKLANTVVESLFLGKKVSLARVLEDVVANQVKLLGPHNLHNCLSGYLAPIYFAKNVLTWAETQDYRLTQDGGDPDDEREADQETETEPEADQEPIPNTIEEVKEPPDDQAEAGSDKMTQSRAKPAGSPPQTNLEVERPIRSEEKKPEADLSQGPDFSSPQRPAREQEAQGDYTLEDPALDPTGRWQIVPDRIAFQDYQGPELAPVQQAGQIISWADLLRKDLAWRDKSGTMWRHSWVVFPNHWDCNPGASEGEG